MDDFWTASYNDAWFTHLIGAGDTRIFMVEGLPGDGIPGDPRPTAASVDAKPTDTAPAYMIVDGVATKPDQLQGYLDIILEMIIERDVITLFTRARKTCAS